ncbi:MAG: glycosyltransferase [bacterium]|nr:glycosyltransferase [bacterium]
MDKRSIRRREFTGIRRWLAQRFACLNDVQGYVPHVDPKRTDCLYLPREFSAAETWSRETLEVAAFTLLCVIISSLAIAWRWGIGGIAVAVSVAGGLFYITTICVRLYLTFVSLFRGKPETGDACEEEKPGDVPVYSILVPLYHEERVIPGLLKALTALDWPRELLEILLVVDSDDELTIAVLKRMKLPKHIRVIAVRPDPYLRSKPRVLNAALCLAKGEFVVVYDAEDRPERDQLKKAWRMFRRYPNIACLQARLDYYNESQNVLTRWFVAEYAAWFGYTLPALSALKLPVPLGGTSNHFRAATLKTIGGWDPYNVTEDCDMGMRIYRLKGRCATLMLNSTTYEEASADIRNWICQRRRWIKGFFQTFIVHVRHPVQAIRNFGVRGFAAFTFCTFGGSVVHLVNIVFWSLFVVWLCGGNALIAPFFPPFVRGMHLFAFIFGNVSLVLLHVLVALKERRYITALVSVFMPLYWGLMAVAVVQGFYQLLTKPHHWDKTHHWGEFLNDSE